MCTSLGNSDPWVCSVGLAGYNIRQQAQLLRNALKNKNQDTNGETICWEQTFSLLLNLPHQDFHSLFSFVRKGFMKKDTRNDHCAQRSSVWVKLSGTDVHFHSNWGIFIVAKHTEISQDTQYYLWKKALCLCCIAVTISGGIIALKLELQSVEVYSTKLPQVDTAVQENSG